MHRIPKIESTKLTKSGILSTVTAIINEDYPELLGLAALAVEPKKEEPKPVVVERPKVKESDPIELYQTFFETNVVKEDCPECPEWMKEAEDILKSLESE